jgi:hypothetical protein
MDYRTEFENLDKANYETKKAELEAIKLKIDKQKLAAEIEKADIVSAIGKLIDKEIKVRVYNQKLQYAWKKLIIRIYKTFLTEKEENNETLLALREQQLVLNSLEYEGYTRGFNRALELVNENINYLGWEYGDEDLAKWVEDLAKKEIGEEIENKKTYE